jgi:hypothetical protein
MDQKCLEILLVSLTMLYYAKMNSLLAPMSLDKDRYF